MNTLLAGGLVIVVALVVAVGAFAAIEPELSGSGWPGRRTRSRPTSRRCGGVRRRTMRSAARRACAKADGRRAVAHLSGAARGFVERLDAVVRADPDVKRVDDGQAGLSPLRGADAGPAVSRHDRRRGRRGEAGTGASPLFRSLLGRGDFGTNKARLKSWTSGLGAREADAGAARRLTPATQADSRRSPPPSGRGDNRNMVPKPAAALPSYPPRPAIGKGDG